MPNPGSITNSVPDRDRDIRSIRDAERTAQENAAARTLAASQIGNGGLLKIDGSLQVTGSITVPGTLASAGALSAGTTVTAGTTVNSTGNTNVGADLNVTSSIYNLFGKNNPVTTGFVAAYFNGPDGRIAATPSSIRYKQDITSANTDEIVKAILSMPLVRFRYIAAVDELGDAAPSMLGPIAEYAAQTALREWVYNDADDRPDGVNIERLTIPLIATVQSQAATIQRQQAQIDELTARMDRAGL